MLFTDIQYQIKTYEEKLRMALEAKARLEAWVKMIHEMEKVKQTSSSSTKTRVKVVYRERKPSFYIIIVNVEVGYDPSSSETVIVAIYKGNDLIGCFDCTFYPSAGVWHPAKNVRKFSIPIIASSQISDTEISAKVFDTSGNEKNVNYIELTTEVRGVA